MTNEAKYEASKLKCSFNQKHFVCHQLVVLKCQPELGYSKACLDCISEQVDYSGRFRCPLCQNEHRKEAIVEASKTYQDEIDDYNTILKENLKSTLDDMLAKFKKTNEQIKEKFSIQTRSTVIENVFEFLAQALLIRVESVQVELEQAAEQALERIERFRGERLRAHANLLDNANKNFQILSSSTLRSSISSSSSSRGVDALRAFDMFLISVARLREKFDETTAACNFEIAATTETKYEDEQSRISRNSKFPRCHFYHLRNLMKKNSNSLPNRTIIGTLTGLISIDFMERQPISEAKIEIIDLRRHLKSCCGIAELIGARKNHQIALTDYSSFTIKVLSKYDSHEMVDLKVEDIDMFRLVRFKNFYAIGTDLDETSLRNVDHTRRTTSLFVCDMDLNRVLIYDLGIKKLKRILTGTPSEDGKCIDEFECPRDISHYAGRIYILDQVKNSIDIFTSTGDYVRSFRFNADFFAGRCEHKLIESPLSVRVHAHILAIVDWKKCVALFTDLDEPKLSATIELDGLMSMCLSSSCSSSQGGRLKLFMHSHTGDFIAYELFNNDDHRISDDDVEKQIRIEPKMIYHKNFTDLKCSSEFMIYSHATKSFILTLGWSKYIAIIRF